jgi:hypothetical protein
MSEATPGPTKRTPIEIIRDARLIVESMTAKNFKIVKQNLLAILTTG